MRPIQAHRLGAVLLPVFLIPLTSLCACRSGDDPARARALLVVLPGATGVEFTRASVSYRVVDRYPGAPTLRSLRDALAGHGCTVLDKDPLNPEPVLRLNRWTDYEPDGGGAATLIWTGAWTCGPRGEVVMFSLHATRERAEQPSSPLEVQGAYYSPAQLRAARRLTGSVEDLAPDRSFGNSKNVRLSASYQTCSVCGSTREKVNDGPWKVLYASPASPTHEHHWEDGVSFGAPVRDGQVVLVRLRVALDDARWAYGAFVLESQRMNPHERTDYRWIARTDGGSVLDPTDAAVSQGMARAQNRVTFGPFSIPWSAHIRRSGFLYYPRFPGSGHSSSDWQLCITDLTSFAGIDAGNLRFVHRTSPVD